MKHITHIAPSRIRTAREALAPRLDGLPTLKGRP